MKLLILSLALSTRIILWTKLLQMVTNHHSVSIGQNLLWGRRVGHIVCSLLCQWRSFREASWVGGYWKTLRVLEKLIPFQFFLPFLKSIRSCKMLWALIEAAIFLPGILRHAVYNVPKENSTGLSFQSLA